MRRTDYDGWEALPDKPKNGEIVKIYVGFGRMGKSSICEGCSKCRTADSWKRQKFYHWAMKALDPVYCLLLVTFTRLLEVVQGLNLSCFNKRQCVGGIVEC